MRVLLFFCAIIATSFSLQAQQLFETPFNSNPHLYLPNESTSLAKGGGNIDTIDLPIIDDFSYNSLYPSTDFWIGNSVYINQTMAINPPTIGVATFDALDATGTPYANGGQGSADTLTSCPLKLAGRDALSNVNLSFFYQPKGFGDKPGSDDSLLVEFRDILGQWNVVYAYADTTPSNETPSFNFVSIPVTASVYFYDGFQFRFRNLARLSGSRDHWHIDYVRFTEAQTPSTTLNDVAFVASPKPFLKNYSSMPWKHFDGHESDELARQNQIILNNHFSTTQFVSPSEIVIYDAQTGSNIIDEVILDFASNPINGNIPAGFTVIDSVLATGESTEMIDDLTSYTPTQTDEVNFNIDISISPSNQQGSIPAVVRNDAIRKTVKFKNYFAYDDGSAETAVAAGRLGDEFAVRFHANEADTLRAIQFHLPRLEGKSNTQRVNLKVWVDVIDDTPDWRQDFAKAIFTDSLQGWTTYSLDTTPLFIPAGSDFYVGWQQATSPTSIARSFLLGYDKNSPNGFKFMYQNIGAGWERMDTVNLTPSLGSIMIRPIVGNTTLFTTKTERTQLVSHTRIYPNPTNNILNVELKDGNYNDFHFQIFNLVGQPLMNGQLSQQLSTQELANGMYLLKIMDNRGRVVDNHKFMVVK